jgi:hypothetical protein
VLENKSIEFFSTAAHLDDTSLILVQAAKDHENDCIDTECYCKKLATTRLTNPMFKYCHPNIYKIGDILFWIEYLLEDWMFKKKNNLGKDYKTIVYTYIYFCSNY